MLINVDVNVDYMLLSTGWWFQSLWKMLLSWGGYSQYMEKKNMFQTTNQSSII